ncbi:hypothetical protein C8R46DRAFT_893826 [Mycena filopes]|nr:hypothetical protein C8R46DRAFT_893826 [Mycena filopes]
MLPRLDARDDDVTRPLLAVFAPHLSKLSGDAIRDELFRSSKRFLDGLNAIQLPHTVQRNLLQVAYTVPAHPDPSSRERPIYPSHLLAVSTPQDANRPMDAHVALIPIHAAVFAANCAYIDLPPPAAQQSDQRLVSLTAHRLTIFSSRAFITLRLYMYGRRIDSFLEAILPFPDSFRQQLRAGDAAQLLAAVHQNAGEVRRLADNVVYCTPGGAYPMWDRVKLLQEVWATMRDLGMYEGLLWQALDLAWTVARCALVSTSQAHAKVLAAQGRG